MDMTPPETPSAITQSVYQPAKQAFDRLVSLQAWLATEQAAVPALPDAIGSSTLAAFRAELDAYWGAPPTAASTDVSRRAAIARHVADAAIDLAFLSHEDGGLDDAALALVQSVVAARSGNPPPGVQIRELMFGPTAYAGVLLIQDDRTPGRTLSFSADSGWELFTDLANAHAGMEERARRALASAIDLPGIARQHLVDLGPDVFIGSRDIAGDPFEALAGRIVAMQHDKLQQAWFEFALAGDDPSRDGQLRDAVFNILRLDRVLDVAGALAARHAAMVTSFNVQRLARVPAAAADEWREADDAYVSTLRAVNSRATEAGLEEPQSLPDFAMAALGGRLSALGVTEDPENIDIVIDRTMDIDARLESLQALFEGPEPAHLRLIDLAYQNIASFGLARLSATGSDGLPIAALTDAAIRKLVRDADISTRYLAYIDATFLSGPDAAMRREHARDVLSSHMQFHAAEARLAYYLPEAPRWFRTERAERGHRWIEAVIDAPIAASRARVEGHDIVVSQMTYRDTPLRDILVISPRNPASVPSIVLYTPDAPDGMTFREFEDRVEAGRKFFYHPAFREYLLDRLTAEHAEFVPNGSGRRFAGSRMATWILGTAPTSGYTWTAERFKEREIAGNFLDAAYELDVQHGLRNTRTFTRSADDAHWEYVAGQVLNAQHGPGDKVMMAMLRGVVTAPGHAAQAAWRLYDNIKAGDSAQAVVDFADFYVASLGVVQPLHALSRISVARGIVGARFRSATRIVDVSPARPAAVVFEPRFVARGVKKTGHPDKDGIFAIDGKKYIEHEGNMYAVRYDGDYATWRLTRNDAGPASWGPAVQRTANGSWSYREVGLLGGSGRGAAGNAGRPVELFNEYIDEIEQAFPDAVERDLVVTQMRSELTSHVPATITPAQRVRWNEAARRAAERSRGRARTPAPQGMPLDLRPRVAPPGFQHVLNLDTPAHLWFYGRLPFKESDLLRTLSRSGYSNTSASLRASWTTQGMSTIRVTTVPPTAPMTEIRRAMGNQRLNRPSTFAVRIHARNVYELRDGGPAWAPQPASADLLAPMGGAPDVFHIRPAGGVLRLGNGEFDVISRLPDRL